MSEVGGLEACVERNLHNAGESHIIALPQSFRGSMYRFDMGVRFLARIIRIPLCTMSLLMPSLAIAQEVPSDVAKVLSEYHVQIGKLDAVRSTAIAIAIDAAAMKLKAVQDELTRRKDFQGAKAVQLLLKNISMVPDTESKSDILKDDVHFQRPAECSSIVDQFITAERSADTDCATEKASVSRDTISELDSHLKKYAAEAKLDECVAIEAAIKRIDASVVTASPELTPSEIKDRQRVIIKEFEKECDTALSELRGYLRSTTQKKPVRTWSKKETEALDDLAEATDSYTFAERKVYIQGLIKNLPAVAKAKAEDYLKAVGIAEAKRQKDDAELERLILNQAESQLKESILSWELPQALASRTTVARLSNTKLAKLDAVPGISADLPPLPEAAQLAFSQHDARARLLDDKFDAAAIELRRSFLSDLREILKTSSLRDDHRANVLRIIEFLELPSTDDLDVLRLTPRYLQFPKNIIGKEFENQLDKLLDERNRDRLASRETLKTDLAEIQISNAEGKRYEDAIVILLHWRWRGIRFDPVPVSAADLPWHEQRARGWVLDSLGNACLLRFESQDYSTWHPRRLIRVEGEKQYESFEDIGENWRTDGRFTPGQKVTDVLSVPIGSRVFCLRSRLWTPALLKAASLSYAEISWSDRPTMKSERIEWRDVRLVD